MARGGAVKIIWHGERLKKAVRKDAERKLDLMAEVVKDQVVRNISTSFFASGPSAPGEFPHARQGARGGLLSSIFWRAPSKLSRIVGTTKLYGFFLEVGTSRMAARPFLRRTLNEMKGRLRRIFKRPLPPV